MPRAAMYHFETMTLCILYLCLHLFIVCLPKVSSQVVTEQSPNLVQPPLGSWLTDVEPEPGLVWPTLSRAPSANVITSTPISADEGSSGAPTGGRMASILQRISEKLASIESLQVQTLRRIEGLDYRLTRVEVQVQERGETERGWSLESSRRLQSLESEVGRVQTLLEVVRDEATSIRVGQAELKAAVQSNPAKASETTADGAAAAAAAAAAAPRLQALLVGVNNLRSTTNGLRDDLIILQKNVTLLNNLTRSVQTHTANLATKQDLHRSLSTIQLANSVPPPRAFAHGDPNGRWATGSTAAGRWPVDCSEAKARGASFSGIQMIQPILSSSPFFVQCDMDTREGGWTVIQNRIDGNINFLRDWNDYKYGFGNLATEFWLGLEKIHMLTNQGVYELLIELTDFGLNVATAHYSAFAIGTETEGYDLKLLGIFEGDAGDSLAYHTSMKFSTPDMDQDQWFDGNCAKDHTGGWWYKGCDTSNLNGQYLNGHIPAQFEYKGMYWYDYHGPQYSLMKSKMMIRPLSNGISPLRRLTTEAPTTTTPQPANKGKKNKKKDPYE